MYYQGFHRGRRQTDSSHDDFRSNTPGYHRGGALGGVGALRQEALYTPLPQGATTQFVSVQDQSFWLICNTPGGRLNKKDGLTRYGDSHVKDKTS